MFRITSREVRSLQGAGGELFTRFVDDLIRAEAAVLGVPDVEIKTNLKTTEPDGGVDTEVRVALPGDSTGRFASPTAWQYKASLGALGAPSREIRDAGYAAELIRRGYAYRLCICDDLPPNRSAGKRGSFATRISSINPDAPGPEIITASDLAAWASRFPAVVLHHLRGGLGGQFQTLEGWGRSITAVTPEFVPVAGWQAVSARIAEHANLTISVPEVILALRGEAGVGKTRLVYETLAQMSGAPSLVVYTEDSDTALESASYLSRQQQESAVLVVDECSLETRERINSVMSSARDRIRVIVIDSSSVLHMTVLYIRRGLWRPC